MFPKLTGYIAVLTAVLLGVLVSCVRAHQTAWLGQGGRGGLGYDAHCCTKNNAPPE